MTSTLLIKLNRSVLFQGGYDRQNTGDDAFAAILAWGAKKYWKTRDVRFLKATVPKLTVPARTVLRPHPVLPYQTWIEMAAQIARSSVLIFGGGSVFCQPAGGVWTLSRWLSQIGKLRVGAVGVSIGPYRSMRDREVIKETLKRFSFLVLRDHRSYCEACDMDLPYTPVEGFDLAALMPKIYTALAKTPQRSMSVVGISICHYERYVGGKLLQEKRRENRLLEMLKCLAGKKNILFRILVFNGNDSKGDTQISHQFALRLRRVTPHVEIVPYSEDPFQMWKNVGDCDFIITTRLHSGIFSYMANIPFVQIEYHRKCTDFLLKIGYPKKYRLGDMEIDPLEMGEKILALMEEKKMDLGLNREELIKKAELNFTALAK